MEFTNIDDYFKDSLFLEELNILIKKLLLENFKISNISKSIEYKLLHYLITNYFVFGEDKISIAEVKKRFNISDNKLKTILGNLANAGFVNIIGRAVALSDRTLNNIFNLIKCVQNFEVEAEHFLEDLEDKELKLSEIKKIARRFLENKNYLSYFEKTIIHRLFNYYVERADDLKILLKKKNVRIEDLTENDLLILDYKTRFNSKSKLYEQIDKFNKIIEKASKKYPYAFFITLTVNPSANTVLDAFKGIGKAFKKFMDLIKKKYGIKDYVKVLEFTKAGIPHLHILIFSNKLKNGKDWLIKQDWISKKWESYGMGKIVYIYALKTNGNSFTWLNAYPKNCKSKNISSYLSKYLKKAFYNDFELMYFWVSNLRFYTYSRNLGIKKEDKIKIGMWEFLTSFDIGNFESVGELLEHIKYKYGKRRNYNILDIVYNSIEQQYYMLVG